jgi:hypothetical protein
MAVKDNLLVIRMDVAGLTQRGSSWPRERVCGRVGFERIVEIRGKGRELGRLKVKSLKLKVKTAENPGNRLERLKGDRNDQYSIGVNDQ